MIKPRSKSKNKKLSRREKPIASHIKSKLKPTKVKNAGTEKTETIRTTKEIQTIIRVNSRQVTNEPWVKCVVLQI